MITVTIDGQDVELGDDERLNVVQAAKRAGIEIPHYCWHPSLSVVASCRMCLAEVGEKKPDGTVVMQPKLVPACQTPAKANTVVVTNSEKVRAARATVLELLLLNHPLDCPTCDQAGECFLQDYTYRYGNAQSRLQEPKEIRQDKDYIGDQITLFTDRCVMCTRCVRFAREYSGTHPRRDRHLPRPALQQQARGQRRGSVSGGGLVQQRFPVQTAGLVADNPQQRMPRLQHGMQHLSGSECGPCLSTATARESPGPGVVHVR
jgi:NADH dehydrogenase/NADH:ubiquinone oxidoreductase subunit G